MLILYNWGIINKKFIFRSLGVMIMKKIKRAVFIAVGLSVLTGCAGMSSGESSKTVATDGSTSMEKVIGTLGEAFESENDGVKFTYNPTGSGSGIRAVLEGRCDIGLSSRMLKEE
jgi:phosphate transport system substrate-binding protein